VGAAPCKNGLARTLHNKRVQSVPITTKVVSLNPSSWRDVLNTTLCDKVCQ
jgi:hypothetical protein